MLISISTVVSFQDHLSILQYSIVVHCLSGAALWYIVEILQYSQQSIVWLSTFRAGSSLCVSPLLTSSLPGVALSHGAAPTAGHHSDSHNINCSLML